MEDPIKEALDELKYGSTLWGACLLWFWGTVYLIILSVIMRVVVGAFIYMGIGG